MIDVLCGHQLYHFCPAHLLNRIKKHGLTLGRFPIMTPDGVAFIPNVQWLTTEPDPDKQSWATQEMIHYSRTEYRLSIDISEPLRGHLFSALDFVGRLPTEARSLVTDWAGSEHWYVYVGQIPPFWIRSIDRMPQNIGKGDHTGSR